MRRTPIIVVTFALALIAPLWLGGSQEAAATNAFWEALFAKRVAGSFMLFTDNPGTPPIPGLVTINEEHTFTTTDATDSGAGVPDFGFESPGHGAWRRTGSHSATGTALSFNFDEKGGLTSVTRFTIDVTFANNFDSFEGTFDTALFPPDQVLDPNAEPIVTFPTTTTAGFRINAL